jgi:hypothetical protein
LAAVRSFLSETHYVDRPAEVHKAKRHEATPAYVGEALMGEPARSGGSVAFAGADRWHGTRV